MAYCDRIALPGGGVAWVRLSGPRPASCHYCTRPHSKLCDFPLGNGKTCDRRLCEDHAARVGDDVDHCKAHRERGDAEQQGLW